MLAKPSDATDCAAQPPTFESIYAGNVLRVARMARGMGVRANALDDVVQDVFLVVHKKLDQLEGPSVGTWLFAILLRVVSNHRRALRRKGSSQALGSAVDDTELLVAPATDDPHERLRGREASKIWQEMLVRLGPQKADILVMFELEGRSVVEIAWQLGVPLNTAYSRLRAARRDFSRLVTRRVGKRAMP